MNHEELPNWAASEPRAPAIDQPRTWYLAGRAAALSETNSLRTALRVWQSLGVLAASAALFAWWPVPAETANSSISSVASHTAKTPREEIASLRPFEIAVGSHDSSGFIAARNRSISRRRAEDAHRSALRTDDSVLRTRSFEELERSS